jgi:hypothetical protein
MRRPVRRYAPHLIEDGRKTMNQDSRNSVAGIAGAAKAGRSRRQELEAMLIDTARTLRAARERLGQAAEFVPMLDRSEDLLRSARAAADAKARLLARDCMYQVERELVATMNDDERRAAAAAYQAESEGLEPWRRLAARSLSTSVGADCSVAAVQGLMRNAHEARLESLFAEEDGRGQIAVTATLLFGAAAFVAGWALVGGLDWVLQNDVEITLAMLLVNGMMFGYLGALLSSALRPIRLRGARGVHDLCRTRIAAIARPLIGAVVAVPVVLILQSGLIGMGEAPPAIDLLICFAGGFLERGFAAQVERGAARSTATR